MQTSPRVAQTGHDGTRSLVARARTLGTAIAVVVALGSQVASAGPAASEDGRRRVRGDRAERASIHAAWTPPAHDPDRETRESLAAFEADALTPSQTIVAAAPEPWMKKLALPALPVRWNRGLVEYLRYFTKDPRGISMMRAWLRRAGRYEAVVRRILVAHEVPEDLVWVVMAESGFNPRVRSPVGAAGPWQFMEGTGGVYGLSKSYWIDWRFDIERSTEAAATYLQDLRVRFGSWELALAAYNAGYGLVMTSIERHNTNNFWALAELESGLPHATVNYVPKIVAAAIIAKNRDALGFGAAEVEPLPAVEWVSVEVERSTTLAEIARLADVDPELLAELNAHLLRGRTPPGVTTRVRVPKAAKERFAAARGQLEVIWSAESTHVTREGERLADIAAIHGIAEKELRKRNGVRDTAEVTSGVALVVPAGKATAAAATAERPLAAVIPLEITADQRLVFFEVTRATTTASLARAFAAKWERIVAWNDLDPHARLQPGQLLQLVVPKAFDAKARGVVVYEKSDVEYVVRGSREHLEASLARRGKLRRAIKAKKGDTLESIGRRSDLTTGDLARINGYAREHAVTPGELVIVYVDDRHRKGTVDAPPPRGHASRPQDGDSTGAADLGDDGTSIDALPSVDALPSADAGAAKKSSNTKSTTKASSRPSRPRPEPSTASSSRVPMRRRGSP
jgi:membrane-bound lytic murein transglycosylase D